MRSERRYVIVGAGAVGGAIAGTLALAGAEVVAIARGAQLDALRRDSLVLETPSRSASVRLEVAASPSAIHFRPEDVVLLCVKSQDTAAALDALASAAPRDLPLLCAQNGIDNEPLAAARFDRVFGIVVFAPLAYVEPGRVRIHAAPEHGCLDLGRHLGADARAAPGGEGDEDLAVAIAADLARAGWTARVEPRIARLKHGKLLGNLGNVLQALSGRDALDGPLLAAVEAEALACFAAAGIEHASRDELRARYGSVRDLPVGGSSRAGGSTWQSLARGTGSIETEHLNGAIVRLGEKHGVATPVNRALVELAREAVARRWPPGRLSAAELADAVRERQPASTGGAPYFAKPPPSSSGPASGGAGSP